MVNAEGGLKMPCKHGKEYFCCECEYGKHNMRDFLDKPIDAVEEMNRNHKRIPFEHREIKQKRED